MNDSTVRRSGRPVARSVLGTVGSVVGALAIGALATQVLPTSQCGDDPGFCEFLDGAAAGLVIGGVLGAGLPPDGGVCPVARRLAYAGGGVLTSLAVSWVALGFMPAHNRSNDVIFFGTLGSGIGAGIGASRCRPAR